MRRGFTLIEIVVALLVLEVGVVGVVATLLAASKTMGDAERVERATGRAASLLDSLRSGAVVGEDSASFVGGVASWRVDSGGRLDLQVRGRRDERLRVSTVVPLR